MGEVITTLEGTVIDQGRRRVKARRRLHKSNVPPDLKQGVVIVTEDEEWQAFYQLPPELRDVLREEFPFDQSAVHLLAEWRRAAMMGASVREFCAYMRRCAIAYVNATMDVWDLPPPVMRELPRWRA